MWARVSPLSPGLCSWVAGCSGQGGGGLLPLLVDGGRASGPSSHFQASLWGLPALATPPVLCWNRGRVAGFQLHVPSWAECQEAGLGTGPAVETVQLGRSGGKGAGQGEGSEATGQRRGGTGVPWVGTPTEAWHFRAQAPNVRVHIPAHPLPGCVAWCQ